MVDAWKRQSQRRERPLSAADADGLQNVVSYIADHYAFDIPLERFASIACMSETKLKGLLQAAVRVQHHAVHSGTANESGGAPAHKH